MQSMWSDHDWTQSHGVSFPRVATCDLRIRRLGNIHRYSTQCTLVLNLLTEKIYIFLWFWFIILGVATFLGIITWLIRILMPGDRLLFVRNHIGRSEINPNPDQELLSEFLHGYLKQDGAFLLRLISANTNAVCTTEVTSELWDFWLDKYKAYDQDDNH